MVSAGAKVDIANNDKQRPAEIAHEFDNKVILGTGAYLTWQKSNDFDIYLCFVSKTIVKTGQIFEYFDIYNSDISVMIAL